MLSNIHRKINIFEVLSFSLSTITIICVVFCSCRYLFLIQTDYFHLHWHLSFSFPSFSSTHRNCSQLATSKFVSLRPLPFSHYGLILAYFNLMCSKHLFILQLIIIVLSETKVQYSNIVSV